jgi:hypothetical protein
MDRVIISRVTNHRPLLCRWLFFFIPLSCLLYLNAAAQTYVGLSLNAGNRQEYRPSTGFKPALAPSGSISISRNHNVNEHWVLRYGAVAGVVGYKLKVVMIDTLGPNGDVSPFPEYSTIFASAEFLIGRRVSIRDHNLLIGAGVGITTYVSTTPTTLHGVEVILPNNNLVTLFDARMTSPASPYSFLWKVAACFDINTTFSLGIEYVYHNNPAAEGSYIFYHTERPHSGTIEIYQREFRLGVFYKLGGRE